MQLSQSSWKTCDSSGASVARDDNLCCPSLRSDFSIRAIEMSIPSARSLCRRSDSLTIERMHEIDKFLMPCGQAFCPALAHTNSESTTAFTSAPSALPFNSFMTAPISLPASFLSCIPSSAFFFSAMGRISSWLIIWGR